MNAPVAEQLTPRRHRFLDRLMRELGRESDRVLRVRRRTEEGLRACIESGAVEDNRAVDRLIAALEQRAVALRDAEVPPNAGTSLALPSGAVRVASPTSMKLRHPDHALDTRDVREHAANADFGADILRALDTVQVRALAGRIHSVVAVHGPLTIAGVVERTPLEAGVEELVGFLRIERAVGAANLDRREAVSVGDRDGGRLSATLPAVLLSAELFPASLDELVVWARMAKGDDKSVTDPESFIERLRREHAHSANGDDPPPPPTGRGGSSRRGCRRNGSVWRFGGGSTTEGRVTAEPRGLGRVLEE